ncbi:tRNA dihydrouridine synthase DusB [Salinispirillum sp. LH 10-3-1]|uniref:tRNA-dihydrouridine synthase B n=1 Tax=Salinispirillum sp. LH 10-3-1 TaxID=2952525 RepID=A0AB38YJU9_9GAMM
MNIGSFQIDQPLVLAPMAGVTDLPFRQLCRELGAGLAVSEMVTADSRLWHTRKSRLRLDHSDEAAPISVQIAGSDPEQMAEAARLNADHGAQIIDINMGCPAKKVCNKAAGSALLQDEALVARILESVVNAVNLPVTLKIRTGWSPEQRNGVAIARLAEACGIQALAVHGRTRACKFQGEAEYDTIKQIKEAVSIPVLANGDITSGEQAAKVMAYTGADGIMIGRAAQGNPWIFREITEFLATGRVQTQVTTTERRDTLVGHIRALYAFYDDFMGVRIARKHVGWYLQAQPGQHNLRQQFNRLDTPDEQLQLIHQYFDELADTQEKTVAA